MEGKGADRAAKEKRDREEWGRELAASFNAGQRSVPTGQPGEGWRLRPVPFAPEWFRVVPPRAVLGAWWLVRRDGAVLQLSSNPTIHRPRDVRTVITERGAEATPEELEQEIRRRTDEWVRTFEGKPIPLNEYEDDDVW